MSDCPMIPFDAETQTPIEDATAFVPRTSLRGKRGPGRKTLTETQVAERVERRKEYYRQRQRASYAATQAELKALRALKSSFETISASISAN